MQKTLVASAAMMLAVLTVCFTTSAHHGSAVYETTKVVVLKDATVTKFIWANPHSIVMFDAKDEKGNTAHWAAEAGSPSALSLIGWTKNSQSSSAEASFIPQAGLQLHVRAGLARPQAKGAR